MERLITVIGGAGYIGSHVVRRLLAEKYHVRVFDNFTYGHDGLANLRDQNLEIREGDLCDIRAVSRAISGADTVVLLAALVGRRVDDFQLAYMREVNLLASSVALDSAVEHGASRFIFASTDSVYGVQSGVMYETGTPEPVSLYSRLKLRMEEQVLKAKRRRFHPTVLRISTCYGYSPRMRFDLVINGLVRDALLKKEIVIDSGDECRAYVHVDDVARAICSCIRAHVSLISGEIFNVGMPEQAIDLNHLANTVKTLLPETTVTVLGRKAELVDYHLSCSKIQKILDFAPEHSIVQGMQEVLTALVEGKFQDPYSPKYRNT